MQALFEVLSEEIIRCVGLFPAMNLHAAKILHPRNAQVLTLD